jgi:hypothetical protein
MWRSSPEMPKTGSPLARGDLNDIRPSDVHH